MEIHGSCTRAFQEGELNEAGEKSNQVGALSSKWLIKFLEMHYYIVPMHCAPYICKKLGMEENDIGLPAYYCDVKVWLPEKQFGIEAVQETTFDFSFVS